jgi:predicted HAD superfamily Cof-like phosphohydrolase
MLYNYQTIGDKLNIFHAKMGEHIPYKYDNSLLRLRKELISEEFDETWDAIQEIEDLAYSEESEKVLRGKLLKELCDLVYVAVGTAAQLGMDFDSAMNRVHKNNMTKWENPRFREDGKLLKPEGYETVNLEDLV